MASVTTYLGDHVSANVASRRPVTQPEAACGQAPPGRMAPVGATPPRRGADQMPTHTERIATAEGNGEVGIKVNKNE